MPSRVGSSGMSGLPKWEKKIGRSEVVVAPVGIRRDTGVYFTLRLSNLGMYIVAVTLSFIIRKYITNKSLVRNLIMRA